MHVTFSSAFSTWYGKTRSSDFCKVVWQHTEGVVGSIVCILLEIYFSFQQWKKFENPLRINKVIAMSLVYYFFGRQCIYTGWLKLKYPTAQNGISRQPCEIFIPKFLGLYGRYPATILNFKKYFSFIQCYGCINILCHIFNSAWNNQQQLVIFIDKKHLTIITNIKIWQVVHFIVWSKCPPKCHTSLKFFFQEAQTDTHRIHNVNENYKLLLIMPCRIENVA